jgi:hypothetical protein
MKPKTLMAIAFLGWELTELASAPFPCGLSRDCRVVATRPVLIGFYCLLCEDTTYIRKYGGSYSRNLPDDSRRAVSSLRGDSRGEGGGDLSSGAARKPLTEAFSVGAGSRTVVEPPGSKANRRWGAWRESVRGSELPPSFRASSAGNTDGVRLRAIHHFASHQLKDTRLVTENGTKPPVRAAS